MSDGNQVEGTADQAGHEDRESDDRTVPLSTMLDDDGPADTTDTTGTTEEPHPRMHPLSVGHLVCGLVFLGIAGSWGLRQAGVIESDGVPWVLPLVLVVAGGAGLLALLAKGMFGSRG